MKKVPLTRRKLPHEMVCVGCGKLFNPRHIKNNTCSYECVGLWNNTRIKLKVEAKFGKPVKDLLQELYVDKTMTQKGVSNFFGISNRTVIKWIEEYGFEKRNLMQAGKIAFKKNPERFVNLHAASMRWFAENPGIASENAKRGGVAACLKLRDTKITSIEKAIKDVLDMAGLPYIFQFPVENKFVCDFLVCSWLVVECDGTYWHSSKEVKQRDRAKNGYLRKLGYGVVRFSEDEIKEDVTYCLSQILTLLLKPVMPIC